MEKGLIQDAYSVIKDLIHELNSGLCCFRMFLNMEDPALEEHSTMKDI